MANVSKKPLITCFGVEFNSDKPEHINLSNFLQRTYRCTIGTLAERISDYYEYKYIDKDRLIEYAHKCKKYLQEIGGQNYENLSKSKLRIVYGFDSVLDKIQDSSYQPSTSKDIDFSYYDLDKCILGTHYTDKYFDYRDSILTENYLMNMDFFKTLNKDEFDHALNSFLSSHKEFYEIRNLEDAIFPGCYILVLDRFKQVYIGKSYYIAERIVEHLTKILPYDRRIFGDPKTSKISIDSFGYKDITRIFVAPMIGLTGLIDDKEKEYVETFPNKYLANRIHGGIVFSLEGNIKPRQ